MRVDTFVVAIEEKNSQIAAIEREISITERVIGEFTEAMQRIGRENPKAFVFFNENNLDEDDDLMIPPDFDVPLVLANMIIRWHSHLDTLKGRLAIEKAERASFVNNNKADLEA